MPDGRAYTETAITRHLDGTTVPAEVVEAATTRQLRRQTRTVAQRLRHAANDVQRLPGAFWTGLVALHEAGHVALIRSPANAQLGGNPNPPESRPPSGADRVLRADLIRCSQKLMHADRAVLQWDWPGDPHAWEPAGVAYQRAGLVMCDADGTPCWREPDDLTTRLVDYAEVDQVCGRLTGQLRALAGYTWGDEQDADADIALEVVGHVSSAVAALRHAGVWLAPVWSPECGVCGSGSLHSVSPPRCKACHEYHRRTGRERPQHLWRAA